MSGQSIVDQIKHYQKDIDRCPENAERMMRCLQRLYVLPIQVQHLQETGVGRSVNSLRKYSGNVGQAAKALVCKWKAMVAAEESSDGEQNQLKSNKRLEVPEPSPPPQPVIKEVPRKDSHSGKSRNSSSSSNHKSGSSSKHQNGHTESKSQTSTNSSQKRSHSSNSRDHGSSKKHCTEKAKKEVRRSTSPEASSTDEKEEVENSGHRSNKRHTSKKDHKNQLSESEDESSDDSDRMQVAEVEKSEESASEEESQEEEEKVSESSDESESSSSGSSDHRHRSKNHKVSTSSSSHHHKHKKSSHSSNSRENGHQSSRSSANSSNKDHHKGKDRHHHRSSSKSDKHSSPSSSTDKKHSSSKTKDLKELIKENEKKVKKENFEFEVPKQKVGQSGKNVKIERNEDGSIDSGSGVGFGDALLVVDKIKDSSKKKKPSSSTTNSSHSSSNHKSSPSSSTKSSSGTHHSSSSSSHSSSSRSHQSSSRDKSSKSGSSKSDTSDLLKPPELLTKKIKLEALDLDISSTLPEISPHYKPLPQVPENVRRSVKSQNETDAMFSIMTTKNQRTKVFSGNKAAQQAVQSLFQMCIQILYENIDAVEYTGGVPYDLLKPLLERLNADQLYVLEHYNPYLIEDTDILWKFHCSKDFRSEQRQDMESWRDLYLRCVDERERKLKTLTAKVSESMAKSTPVRQAKLAYVDSVVKPPRNVARKQAKYGTASATPVSSNTTKQAIVSKAVVGGHTPGVSAEEAVPPPPASSRPSLQHHPTPSSAALKKKKAPLMQKALQFIKGNRYKR